MGTKGRVDTQVEVVHFSRSERSGDRTKPKLIIFTLNFIFAPPK